MATLPVVDGFDLERKIGAGAMGDVYSAVVRPGHPTLPLGEGVAIKVIRPGILDESLTLARFRRELQIGMQVCSPNLLRTFSEAKTADGRPCVVMELLFGKPLSVLLSGPEPLEIDEAVRISREIAAGLSALHAAGIVHRDLKPANVMIGESGSVKLMDYGLARLLDSQLSLTGSGQILGTLRYASPEHVGGVVGPPADIWSLGVMLYQMLTGTLPFPHPDPKGLVMAIQTSDVEPPRTLRSQISPALERIVARCLEKNIARRFSDAREIIAALDGRPGPELSAFLDETVLFKNQTALRMESVLPFAPHFSGRGEEKEHLLDRLADAGVSAVVVTGIKGLGKSALMAEAARVARDFFPSGGVYLDVRAKKLDFSMLTEELLRDLEMKPQPGNVEHVLIEALRTTPTLLVIDSAETFSMDDWESLRAVFEEVERLRSDGGFEAFPSAILVGTRVLPDLDFGPGLHEIVLSGLSDEDGARLLSNLVRDLGPREWEDDAELRWISSRVGGHPEILRLIAQATRRIEYKRLRRNLESVGGRILERIEAVIGWSAERLGPHGRRLLPFLALFDELSFLPGELAAAAELSPESLDFEAGLDELQFTAGLIHFIPHGACFRFHASLLEWTRRGLQQANADGEPGGLLNRGQLESACLRLAAFWNRRLERLPENPQSQGDLLALLSTVRYYSLAGEPEAALDTFMKRRYATSFGGSTGEEGWQLLARLGMFGLSAQLFIGILDTLKGSGNHRLIARAQLGLGRSLVHLPTGSREKNLYAARRLALEGLESLDEHDDPVLRGSLANLQGTTFLHQQAGDVWPNLQRARECFEQALNIIPRQDAPFEWASAMNNLGLIWFHSPPEYAPDKYSRAIECFEKVLLIWNRDENPHHWAGVLGNMGSAYQRLKEGDRAENIRRSIECFEGTLSVLTREASPVLWGNIMNNLGNTWLVHPGEDRRESLLNAVRHYEQALGVRKRDDAPFKWALTQSNLGHALMLLGADGDRESLKRAVACHRAALEVMTRREFPLDWIQTMLNLASTLRLNPGGNERNDLRQALDCYDQALAASREHGAGEEHDKDVINERLEVLKRLEGLD